MLEKTSAVVLRLVAYGDTSQIATVYSEQFGLETYMFKGVKGKKKKGYSSLFPMMLLQAVVYHKPGVRMHTVAEFQASPLLGGLLSSPRSMLMAQLMAEACAKSLKAEQADDGLYRFLVKSVLALDQRVLLPADLPSWMMALAETLGFGPTWNEEGWFNLHTGQMDRLREPGAHYARAGFMQPSTPPQEFPIADLQDAVRYFQFHIPGFGSLRTLEVLAAFNS